MTASVAKAFSAAAASYDDNASLQVQAGRWLLGGLESAATALDVGCGTGWVARSLREAGADRVVGVDLSPSMIERAAPLLDVACVADMASLPLADGTFDLVCANLSLQWSPVPQRALAEMWRVMRPGGRLAFTVPLPGSLAEIEASWHAAGSEAEHINEFDGSALWRERLNAVAPGCEVVCEEREFVRWFETPADAMRSIKQVGAQRVLAPGRRRGLMSKTLLSAALAAYESRRTSRGIPLSYRLLKLTTRRN